MLKPNSDSVYFKKKLKQIKNFKTKKTLKANLLYHIPILRWYKKYKLSYLKNDLISGFVMALVVIPQCLAFADIAGIPARYAFYTAIIIPLVSFFFSPSLYMISGPSIALSIVIYSMVSTLAVPHTQDYVTLVLALSFLAGVFEIILFFLKFNVLLHFVSHAVVKSFTFAAGIIILIHELYSLWGMKIQSTSSAVVLVFHFFRNFPESYSWQEFSIGALTILLWFIFRLKVSNGIAICYSIVVASVVGFYLHLYYHFNLTFETAIANVVPTVGLPLLTLDNFHLLYKPALSLGLISLLLASSISFSVAEKYKQHSSIKQEILHQGLTNFIGGFFATYMSTASFSRTALNTDCSGKTPLAGVFSSIFTIIIALFLSNLVSRVPSVVIAGVIIIIGFRLIPFKDTLEILKASRTGRIVIILTLFSALVLDLQISIVVGVITSMVVFIFHVTHPNIYSVEYHKHSDNEDTFQKGSSRPCPQVMTIQINGSIYFASSSFVSKSLSRIKHSIPKGSFLLILGNGITSLDWDGSHMLERKSKRWGKYMCISGLAPHIKEGLDRYNIDAKYLRFKSKTTALNYLLDNFNVDICRTCELYVFDRCGALKEAGRKKEENRLLAMPLLPEK